jgi:hypothetical protein
MKRDSRSARALPLALILTCSFAAAVHAQIIHVTFESNAVGPYSLEMIKRDWRDIVKANLYDRAHIVQEEGKQSKVLRIAYPAGAVGPREGGGQFLVPLPKSEELWLSYRVKFGEGFDFKRGGKLPGLTSGGSRYTGGRIPKDGDGWSARYMWRKGGQAVVYLYYVDMPGTYGEDLLLNGATFLPGTWHQLTQHIRVNAPHQSNGVLDVWFDGKKVLSRSDIRFRIGEKGLTDSLYFSTFHGGNTKEWAPGVDSFAFFDDFTISRERPAYLDVPEDDPVFRKHRL